MYSMLCPGIIKIGSSVGYATSESPSSSCPSLGLSVEQKLRSISSIYQQSKVKERPSENSPGRVLPTALRPPPLAFPSSFITAFAFRSWGRFFDLLLATRYLFGTQPSMSSPWACAAACAAAPGEVRGEQPSLRGFLPFSRGSPRFYVTKKDKLVLNCDNKSSCIITILR
jgi:hypothetical protein